MIPTNSDLPIETTSGLRNVDRDIRRLQEKDGQPIICSFLIGYLIGATITTSIFLFLFLKDPDWLNNCLFLKD